ncbi:MAG: SDR family NAD(P)-dependent oxidoreductase [Alphaproteobacteria bacterium]|nr:SDR family NAD(P)-dependent oxidoreductase [Alphaproteobacteria bacterium]
MKLADHTAKNIVITGASSGLGSALAVYYARPGITLYLSGRNEGRLAQTAGLCEELGASVRVAAIDVTNVAAMQQWLESIDNETPIDLVIANAGISAGIGGGEEKADQARHIFATNIDGVVNTISPLIPRMIARGRGQIALISSLAGIRGLPSSPAYSASKAWVRVYGEGLRGWLARAGVRVNVVCPGFIKTPLTDVNPYHMPLLMSADKAARIIAIGLAKNKGRIAFPLSLYLPLWWLTSLPNALGDFFFAKLPDKPAL